MMLSGSVVELERSRRSTQNGNVAKTYGLGGFGGFLLGLVLATVGTIVILVGLEDGLLPTSEANSKYWPATLTGMCFVAGGIFIWAVWLKERLLVKRRQASVAQHPQSEVFADYPWDPNGITKSPWVAVRKSFVMTLLFGIFLVPFNWFAWTSSEVRDLIVAQIAISLFDLALLFGVIELVRRFLTALKYGTSRLGYQTFPLFTGGRVDLMWMPPSGLENATSIKFVLRCVEEWMETTGSGKKRSAHLVHEQVWAAARTTAGPVDCQPNHPIPLSFDVPATAPGSCLSKKKTNVFWELEVCAKSPGVDFQEQYLVPIYSGESNGLMGLVQTNPFIPSFINTSKNALLGEDQAL